MGKDDISNEQSIKKSPQSISMTVCEKFLSSVYKLAFDIQANPNEKQELVPALRARLVDLETFRDRFYDAYTVYSSQCTSAKAQEEIDKRFTQFFDMFYSIQVLKDNIFPNSSNSSDIKTPIIRNETSNKSSNFCLPKIEINSFTGNYTDWPNFIALFDSLIHNNSDLNKVQKMHYLINSLGKEPHNLIKHLELSENNYDISYTILKERYDNKRLIADKHLESILALTSLNQNSANSGLRKFVNVLKENTQALNALGFDVKQWSFILLHIILRKLSSDIRSRFELSLGSSKDIPSFDSLLDYLENQLRVMETVGSLKTSSVSSGTHSIATKSLTVSTLVCNLCKGSHILYNCEQFNKMSPTQRREFVIKEHLCFNCLRPHSVKKCLSQGRCSLCQGKHHTKLHLKDNQGNPAPIVKEAAVSSLSSTVQSNSDDVSNIFTILLGTAIVGVQDVNGYTHKARALLDSGSQVSIITENLAQKLKLPRTLSGTLVGVGGTVNQRTNGRMQCVLQSLKDKTQIPLVTTAVIMKHITNFLPSIPVSSSVIDRCTSGSLHLADERFHIPGPIDVLIGADLINEVFDGKRYTLGPGLPTAHSTIFGWILLGKAPTRHTYMEGNTSLHCCIDLDNALTRFWETEEPPLSTVHDPEDLLCEQHFVDTHTRDESGRFIVRLPFKPIRKPIGDTRSYALKRFYNLERRLLKDIQLKDSYVAFMADYLEAGHMRPISADSSKLRYYIPHHGVLKESSSTTKLRAVFDASSPSSSGISLNQVLMSGPKLQHNVEDIILRFRTHSVVFTCDIKQMYRQIRLHDDDCKYQTIFWRDSPDAPLGIFELTTVTYGVTSSAYLAMRVVHELARLNESTHPEASLALQQDTFVDDVVSGAQDIESAKDLQRQIVEVLSQGGLSVRKWVSNKKEILQGYPTEHLEVPYRFEESGDKIFKVLGVEWRAESDNFIFRIGSLTPCSTKRHILSNIARIYDPCGFLAPVIFYAKSIMQCLWLHKDISWDDPLPEDISQKWNSFASGFSLLNIPHIPRFILCRNYVSLNLIGFCDASEKGFAAVVYLRVQDSDDNVNIHLLLAKSRVAPTKHRRTIPQLELSGAVLLAELINHAKEVLHSTIKITSTIVWCDSSIVLNWISTPPHKLKVFEGNRVSRIQGLLPDVTWRHVPGEMNPADCASRGLLPQDIVDHVLWWSPSWLKENPDTWPVSLFSPTEIPEISGQVILNASVHIVDDSYDITNLYSSYSKLLRVVAWSLRFIFNTRNPKNLRSGFLTAHELELALHRVVGLVQRKVFSDHFEALQAGRSLKGPICRLHPFIDKEGLLRVGGRLKNSNLKFSAKHPILLPKSHNFTNLIIDYHHRLHLHAGASYLITILQQRFWILSARRVVRHRIFQCRRCNQLKVKPVEPLMGDLPPDRVRPVRPFLKVGIDFAGPFNLKVSSGRNVKIGKAYLCLFVCLAVKAIHLEVVSDLSTDAFMASFQRFCSRRGAVSDVYTDCGKNFQGAKRHLSEAEAFVKEHSKELGDELSKTSVNWHMNPPYSPHMGGIWESSVKSAKLLFKRTIGDRPLTFEELSTVFIRIEAVLNSRPLCPISNDPNDLETLTPGHFLIGQPLLAPPEYCFEHIPSSRLHRWQLTQQISQHFWRRWQQEYLHNLQQRWKWYTTKPNLKVGDLVILKEDNLPPLQWRMARVLRLHPGTDDVVRVVELKVGTGTCLRSVSKVCPLPNNDTSF